MESKMISLFLLMAASGCCATLPIPYLAFRLQRIPSQQFFYNPPQRNFIQQQLIPNYEPLRYPQPQSYSQSQSYSQPQFYVQPQAYVQPQQYPYNLYNAPQPLHRDVVSPIFADHYDTVMHYVQRQPVVPFPTYARKPLLLQGPPTKPYLYKDCLDKDLELEKINNKLAATAQADPGHVRRMSSDPEDEIGPVEPPIVGIESSEEENMKYTNFGDAVADVRFGNPGGEIRQENAAESTEDNVGPANPKNPQEGILEGNTAQSTNSEEKVTTANPTNLQANSTDSENEATTANPTNLEAKSTDSENEATTANLPNPQAKSTNSKDETTTVNPPNPQEKSTKSQDNETTANPPNPQAKSTDSENEATTANPPNPQAKSTNPQEKSTNSQDNKRTANPANPQEEIFQDLIAESTAPLGKATSGESANPQGRIADQETVKSTTPGKEITASRSAAPKKAISEAATPSDYPQRETLMAPIKVREDITKPTNAKSTNTDPERTGTTESGSYQQNPTAVVAPPKSNESPAASNSVETQSTSESSSASNKLTL